MEGEGENLETEGQERVCWEKVNAFKYLCGSLIKSWK